VSRTPVQGHEYKHHPIKLAGGVEAACVLQGDGHSPVTSENSEMSLRLAIHSFVKRVTAWPREGAFFQGLDQFQFMNFVNT
jgi:hypothetical protein